jgi:hypothetical protein
VIERRELVSALMASSFVGLAASAKAQSTIDSDIDLQAKVMVFFQALNQQNFDILSTRFRESLVHGTSSTGIIFSDLSEILSHLRALARYNESYILRGEPIILSSYLACAVCDVGLRSASGSSQATGALAALRGRPWIFVFSFAGTDWNKSIERLHILERV